MKKINCLYLFALFSCSDLDTIVNNYVENWNIMSSQYLDNPKGEKCQSIFERLPRKILDLEVF